MVTIIEYWILLMFVGVTGADVCYYDDGTLNGCITVCPQGCCSTEKDPCCPEANEILPFVVGAIVSSLMFMVCFLVCCIYRIRVRNRIDLQEQTVNQYRQQRLSELKQASSQYHIVVFSGQKSRKLEIPPQYSEIYPEKYNLYDEKIAESINKERGSSTKSNVSQASSIKRGSTLRNALRRGQVSESVAEEQDNPNLTDRSSLMNSMFSSFPSFFKKENT